MARPSTSRRGRCQPERSACTVAAGRHPFRTRFGLDREERKSRRLRHRGILGANWSVSSTSSTRSARRRGSCECAGRVATRVGAARWRTHAVLCRSSRRIRPLVRCTADSASRICTGTGIASRREGTRRRRFGSRARTRSGLPRCSIGLIRLGDFEMVSAPRAGSTPGLSGSPHKTKNQRTCGLTRPGGSKPSLTARRLTLEERVIHSPVALAARRSNHVGDFGFRSRTKTGAALTVLFGLYGEAQ